MRKSITNSPDCDKQFKGLLETIEIELKQILADTGKKKHQKVREKTDFAIKWIKENKGKAPCHIDENLTLIIDAFFAIQEAKLEKMLVQALNII